MGEFNGRDCVVTSCRRHLLRVASPLRACAAAPPVCMHRAAQFHAVTNGLSQAASRGIGSVAQVGPPHAVAVQCSGDEDQTPADPLASAITLPGSFHVRPVHSFHAFEAIATHPRHGGADLLQQQACAVAGPAPHRRAAVWPAGCTSAAKKPAPSGNRSGPGSTQVEQSIGGSQRAKASTDSHILAGDLTDEIRLAALPEQTRRLLDCLHTIVYRAETLAGTLVARLAHMANQAEECAVAALCAELNRSRTVHPGTSLDPVQEILPAEASQ